MRTRLPLFLILAVVLGVCAWFFFGTGQDLNNGLLDETSLASEDDSELDANASSLQADARGQGVEDDGGRVEQARTGAVIRGRVLRADASNAPVAGVEVLALDRHPAFADFEVRLRDFIEEGFWKARELPMAKVLARTKSAEDGSFELTGLEGKRVFLDARSDRYYARSYPAVRLAKNEVHEGTEILLGPGGRVRGRIIDHAGAPVPGARIVLRPSAASFLAQITSRSFRWFEQKSDDDGRFDFVGVPPGEGYAITGVSDRVALTQRRKLSVAIGRSVDVLLRGVPGATITGTVRRPDGRVAPGAYVGFAYLDIARVLFSVHGANPVQADEKGRFVLPHIAPGQVAVAALSPDLALAPVQKLMIVAGSEYELDLSLELGTELRGRVVDSTGKPVEGARVNARTLEQPRGFDLSLVTKLVRYEDVTDGDGRFVLRGILSNRFFVEVEHPEYLPTRKIWRECDAREDKVFTLELKRGAFVSGRVLTSAGEPVSRFRVKARSQNRRRMRIGPEWGRPPRRPNPYNDRSPWLRRGEFELQNEKGEFRVGPLEPGKIRLTVDADGYLESAAQEFELTPQQEKSGLKVELTRGVVLRGRVTDGAGEPGVAEAQVTWRKARSGRRGPSFLPFRIDIQPEDFDFMALDSTFGSRSVLSDAEGNFEFRGVAAGTIDVFARHPDYAKSSTRGLEVEVGVDRTDVSLALSRGGSIEGTVRGLDGAAVATATIVCFSIANGVVKSATSDARGQYALRGLAAGPYVVFKAQVDGALSDIFAKMLGSVRLKSTSVREGRVSRVDIEDRTAGGVDLFGRVTRRGKPVPRAVVTLLGQDKGGPFGIGLRSGTADDAGQYEIASVPPGNYLCRVTEYGAERPEVSSLNVVVKAGTRQRVDLEVPSSTLRGIVRDDTGKPLSGVRVRAVRADSSGGPGGILALAREFGGASRGRSRGDGSFDLKRLAPGTWTVRAEPRGDLSDSYGLAEVSGLVVSAGQDRDGVVVVLPRAAVLRGLVVDGGGKPVRGVRVRVTPEGAASTPKVTAKANEASASRNAASLRPEALRGLAKQLRQTSRTGRDGRFRVRGLAPGAYTIRLEKKGLSTSEDSRVVVGLAENAEMRMTMVRSGRLRLRVLDLEGKQLARGQIKVFNSKGQQVGRSRSLFGVMASLFRGKDKAGNSEWLDMGELAPDQYTLSVEQRLEGGKTQIKKTSRVLREGEDARWEVKLRDLVQ